MVDPDSKPKHEKLGMTKEEYEHCMDVVYGMPDEQIRLYNPYAPQVVYDDEPEQKDDDLFDYLTLDSNKQEDDTEEKLGELLGIDDMNEIDRIQKEIENKQSQIESPIEMVTVSEDMEKPKDELGVLSNDLESLYKNEMPEPEEEPVFEVEPEIEIIEEAEYQPNQEEESEYDSDSVEQINTPKKTNKGEGETLFNEIFMSLNGEEPEQESKLEEPLFSEELPVDYETPIFLGAEDNIPVTDEDVPYIPEDDDNEQEKLINVLNLLDNENSRLEQEIVENPATGIEERKQILTNRLSLLAEQGEGKDHMKEIVNTLMELYQLEGKENELRAIKEEYSEYFTEDEMELRIFEEDIIRVDKKKKNPFELPQKYLWIATNSISDGKEGEQRWIGKCIGKNQNYIHFRDMSQRIWINVGKRIEQIEIGDLLAVFVERDEESITAKEVLTLKEVSHQEQEQSVVC